MIQLTRINKTALVLNADLIEHIETTPDTVISLTNGQKFVVLEPADEVMRKAIEYQRQVRQAPESPTEPQPAVEVGALAGPAGEDQD